MLKENENIIENNLQLNLLSNNKNDIEDINYFDKHNDNNYDIDNKLNVNVDDINHIHNHSNNKIVIKNNISMLHTKEYLFSCNICLEIYDDDLHRPKVLDCGHSLCKECLDKCFSDDFRCPTCKAKPKYTISEKVPVNYDFLDIIKELKLLNIIK